MSTIILSLIIGYLSGSVPFGLLLSQAAGLGDIRKIGSGNIGATNVLRTGNKSIAALTLLFDVLKGLIPTLIGAWLDGYYGMVLGGVAAMFGHIFPVWLGFKGGKGVATAAGVMLGWDWHVAITALATWILAFALFRISSLSALCATVIAVVAAWIFAPQLFGPVSLLAVVVIITHRANIARLLKGEEPRSSFSKAP